MPSTVLLGAQWGDEGKGKITDLISSDYDYVVRYQGGKQRRPHGYPRRYQAGASSDSFWRYVRSHHACYRQRLRYRPEGSR